MTQLRERCGDNVHPGWVAMKKGGWIKGKGQIGGVFVPDLRCRCSAVIVANSEEQAGPEGPACWMQVAEILSRQHVLKHAFRLSTLLFDPWQIDREAAAPPPPRTLLTRLVPTQMWTQLMSAAASWLRLCWSQMHESADWGGISLNPQTSKPPGLSRRVSYTWVIIWGAHCCTCIRSGFGISAHFSCSFSIRFCIFLFSHFNVYSCFS